MIAKVENNSLQGELLIPPSKSDAQRAILCATLSSETSIVTNIGKSDDVQAMLKNAEILGADVNLKGNDVHITGTEKFPENLELNIGESGLGLRLMAGICASHEGTQLLTGEGTLLQRNQSFFEEVYSKNGVNVDSNNELLPVHISGKLRGGEIKVDGSQSSQYISGLLMGLPLLESDSVLIVENPTSTPYIAMTISTLKAFGIDVEHEDYKTYKIKGNQTYKGNYKKALGALYKQRLISVSKEQIALL